MSKQLFHAEINGQEYHNLDDFKKGYEELILQYQEENEENTINFFEEKIIKPINQTIDTIKLINNQESQISKILQNDFIELGRKLRKLTDIELIKLKNKINDNIDNLEELDSNMDKLSLLTNQIILNQEDFLSMITEEIEYRINRSNDITE